MTSILLSVSLIGCNTLKPITTNTHNFILSLEDQSDEQYQLTIPYTKYLSTGDKYELRPEGKTYVDKLYSNKVVVDLISSFGIDEKENNNLILAICAGEEKSSPAYSWMLKKAGVQTLTPIEMKKMIDQDLIDTCKSVDGENLLSNKNQQVIVIKDLAYRSSEMPGNKLCHYYESMLKCDISSQSKKLLEVILEEKNNVQVKLAENKCLFRNCKKQLKSLQEIENALK